MNKTLTPLYDIALEELTDLICHNTDLNFGHDLPVDIASFIKIPVATNPGSTLSTKTKSDIMLEIYERQFDESRDGNSITPLHKSVIKLQQDIAIYLVEIDLFMSDLKLFPYKQYFPDTIRKIIASSAAAESNIFNLCQESFMSYLMSKMIGPTEIEMLRNLGNDRILKRFSKPGNDLSQDRKQLALERHRLNQLLSLPAHETNYYQLAQYFADI